MDFSPTTFTIEINGVPTVAFQSKWQADADQICRDWLHTHWDELTERGPAGVELPPVFKLRLARSSEREAYQVGGAGFEFCGESKVVNLIRNIEQHHAEVEHSQENVSAHEPEDKNHEGDAG
jgi:hypothetical protein